MDTTGATTAPPVEESQTLRNAIVEHWTINNEIIQRCEAKGRVTIGYNHHVNPGPRDADGAYTLTAHTEPTYAEAETLRQGWRKPPGVTLHFETIRDLWKDNIDYRVETFADAKRLNNEMLAVSDKYLLLREEPACVELRKFLANFEKLQVCLAELEGQLIDVPNKEPDVRQRVNEINQLLASLTRITAPGNTVICGPGTRVACRELLEAYRELYGSLVTRD